MSDNPCGCDEIVNNNCSDAPEVTTPSCTGVVTCRTKNWTKCIIYDGDDIGCTVVTGKIATFSDEGTAGDTGSYTTTGLVATGGNGTGATFSVAGNLLDNSYTVTMTAPGTGYRVGDILTIAGDDIQGSFTSPANDVTITILTLTDTTTTVNVQIENGDDLSTIIQNLNDRICEMTPEFQDYSSFDYSCLRQTGTFSAGTAITTAEQFAEAAAAALCSLNTRLADLEVPGVTASCISTIASDDTLVEVLNKMIAEICATSNFLDLNLSVTASCFTTVPNSSATLSDWIQWIVTNVCSIKTATDTTVSGHTTKLNSINTYLLGSSSPGAYPTYDTSCMGGSATATVGGALSTIITEVCSLATDVAALPDLDNITLTWASCFSAAPYSYTSDPQDLQTQLERILNVISREKISFSGDFTVSTSACGKSVSLATAPAAFACSDLDSCSIHDLGDVTDSAPTISECGHALRWNNTSGLYELYADSTYTNIGFVDKSGSYASESVGFLFKETTASLSYPCAQPPDYNVGFVEYAWTSLAPYVGSYTTNGVAIQDAMIKKDFTGTIRLKGIFTSASTYILGNAGQPLNRDAGVVVYSGLPSQFRPATDAIVPVLVIYDRDPLTAPSDMTIMGELKFDTLGNVTLFVRNLDYLYNNFNTGASYEFPGTYTVHLWNVSINQ